MRWPWRRNSWAAKDEAALAEAQRRLAEVRSQWPAVHQAAEDMRFHKRRNHFAASIEAIYTTRKP